MMRRTGAKPILTHAIMWLPTGTGMIRCPACERVNVRSDQTRVWADKVRIDMICRDCHFGFALVMERRGERTYLNVEPEFESPPKVPASPALPLPALVAIQLDPQRSFSAMQREELYRRANGHCVGCAQPLDSDWQADHVVPHARGGRTEIVNGQALCQPCNSRKSAKVLTVE